LGIGGFEQVKEHLEGAAGLAKVDKKLQLRMNKRMTDLAAGRKLGLY
jgi:hypothetical protein